MRLDSYAKCAIFDGSERIGKIDSKSQINVLRLLDLDYFNDRYPLRSKINGVMVGV